jgi:DNA-binding transcriptional MerR regulator
MADSAAPVEIPNRPAFKASEVCDIAKLQPYVLRSWESEFPDLGVSKTPGGPRVYRRADVERVLRIRHLVFGEGLTLAGVRRRFAQEEPAAEPALDADDVLSVAAQVEDRARAQVLKVKEGLRSLLELIDSGGRAPARVEFELHPPHAANEDDLAQGRRGKSRR